MTPERRRVLACRSMRDKIGIAADPARAIPGDREEVQRLVAEGLVVWLDRAVISELRVECDVYLLTPAGIALCDAAGIERH